MRVNPDPEKFEMKIAKGVKDSAQVDEMGADAPDIEVPFCKAHNVWPCSACGTTHFDGCECSFCTAGPLDPYVEEREAAAYAASMIRGMERHWRKARETKIADELLHYADVLAKFSQGTLARDLREQ
jgi:hypothetical protein